MKTRRRFPIWFITLLALAIYFGRGQWERVSVPDPAPRDWRTVVRVLDGDTLLLDGNERVRLIGVDTPESVDPRRPVERFGKEAAAFTQRLVEGKRVRLEFGNESHDRFDRTLAFVYLEDGTFLNAEIIRQGYGHVFTRYPFRYADRFRALEREARENRRGLWAPDAPR